MLVLSRKLHETIAIDGTVRITVLQVKGDRVRIGISARRMSASIEQKSMSAAWISPRTLAAIGESFWRKS